MVLYLFFAVSLVSGQSSSNAVPAEGGTTTLLPNGSVLLAGGQDAGGHASSVIFLRDSFGSERQLQTGLQIARTGHTATVLPDGTVLVLGGVGIDGQLVQAAEIFDPQSETSQLLDPGSPTPRVFHTTTLLADGRVLIAGGVGSRGESLVGAELWDSRQRTSSAAGALVSFRRNQSATLLPDGRVLLVGGKDDNGNSLSSAEVFDPQSQTFSAVSDFKSLLPSSIGNAPITVTSPQDGATAVPVDALISVLFSRAARIESINEQTVVLNGPPGMVEAKVTGAEAGMLGFIVPQSPLLPGTTYMVRLSGVAASNGNNTAFKEFTFTTAGEAPPSDLWSPTLDWMTHNGPSAWQNMPPLQARPGVTALAGQVLKLDGTPLAHVKLQIGTQTASSDGTGRFLLANIPAGHSAMMIFGDAANTPSRKYGAYEVGVNVQPGVTNVLPYVIWMTALDTAHAVRIPSPTSSETVITTPLLPGLELHLPANTVITDSHGNTVTEITITPVPLDRPPFPLPRVPVPIYFTIQPGAAYIQVMNASGPKGARLFYPNAHSYPPGTPFQFWNYDADQKGWFIYGEGKVSPDRSQIIPNPGVEIYGFTGAMVSNPGNAPPNGPHPGDPSKDGEPVDLSTGLFIYKKTDLMLPDIIPLALTRTYRQNDPISRAFGIGASQPYDMFIVGDNNTFPEGYTFQDVILADGTRIHFPRTSPCTGANGYCDFTNAVYEHTSSGTDFYGAIIRFQGCSPNGSWTLTKKDGTVYCFPDSDASNNARAAAPTSMHDRYGNSLMFARDGNGNLTQITSPGGRWIQFTYDSSNRITQAKDNINRTVTYSYDAGGRLTQVVDANGGTWNYTYDAFNEMISIQDARGIFYLTNQYDQNGRVVRQTQGDNSVFQFAYTTDPVSGNITQTNVTDPRGTVRRTTFNANGYKTSEILAMGQPEQETITYNPDPNTNLLNSISDGLSHQTSFTYDSLGNLTSITRMAGTPDAVTTSFTYDPSFSQLASVTDPLNHTTTLSRDLSGSLTAISDPLGHQTTIGYNSNGLPVSIMDALGNSAQFGYDGTDLVSLADPLGNTTTRFIDGAGRVAAITDPQGHVTRFVYNALNEVTQKVDATQGVTSISYDGNGNAVSLSNALGNITTWSYDNMDRMSTRTDSLLRQQSYNYDPAGNLTGFTDRKGQVTTYNYDRLNRLTFIGFGTQGSGANATYGSTVSYQYDAGNRMTQAADSVAGTITHGYDTLDRVTSEATPQGSITYGYDAAGRRTSMTVAGQPAVSYSYDNADRLMQITQNSAAITFGYDDANRRTSLGLSNGVSLSYSYDNSAQVTGISYQLGATVLGNLTYTYDQLGRRTQMGGSFARTNLPQQLVSASYDAANELLSWDGMSFSYDANGNMLSDGSNSFTWDSRNHLSTLNGGSLQYDAFNRRTLNAAGTSFLYDAINAVQELTGTTVTANMLTGSVDEIFTRTTSAGTFALLQDALGSTVDVADATGTLEAAYTYDPYGVTSISGPTGINQFQFTGRENEGNGLYFYRSRYYSPAFGRFISEDPIGFGGGDANLYGYVLESPTNFRDPSGQCPWCIIAGIGALWGGIEEGIKGAQCGDSGLKLLGDIGRGALGGAAGALTGLATDSPVLGSLVNDGVNALLGGHVSPEEAANNAVTAAVIGPIAEAIGPEVRGGQNFNPWTSPRTWGPKATQAYTNEFNNDAMNTAAHMAGRSCSCD
jgi:RHS repeat-associated protein